MTADLGPAVLTQVGAGVLVTEHPPVLPGRVERTEVPGGDPSSGLVLVRVPGPLPGELPHVVPQRVEYLAGDHAPVVGRPAGVLWGSGRCGEVQILAFAQLR